MRFKVTTRLEDINFTETFDTKLEALRQATAWSKANLGDVSISDGETTYTPDEFASKVIPRSDIS